MTGVDRLSATASIGLTATSGGQDARALAGAAIGEIGHRVLAWVGAAGGEVKGAAAWSETAGDGSGFTPDRGELARGGDIYDLNGLALSVAGQAGATPTQEGELRRAFEDFTRAAVVQVAGLSGASGERQVEGILVALDAAVGGSSAPGADGVVERLGRATASLTFQNG